uniref:Large ribosomal subunit protein uL22m n=1 Tax=Timema tahoe TaxID=61484 RepID=A0A7R9IKM4_9NEOP|nr:unnamed protein product [Timema tahoe]
MQAVLRCARSTVLASIPDSWSNLVALPALCKQVHMSSGLAAWSGHNTPMRWPNYNKTIFPPQELTEERRLAYVCHMKTNIKYSPWKMWYIACLVRGLSVDEALKQLSFVLKKGATAVKDTIQEAQEMAVAKHNVEFKSNLWVAESFVGKGHVVKGVRRHARGRVGKVEYFHCHYFVRLEEGTPPDHYYYHNRPKLLVSAELEELGRLEGIFQCRRPLPLLQLRPASLVSPQCIQDWHDGREFDDTGTVA